MATPAGTPGVESGHRPSASSPFYCIADEDTVRGFALAGVPGEAVATPKESAEALEQITARPGCELLILTEDLAAFLGPLLDAFRLERSRPVVLVIPAPSGPGAHPGAGGDSLRHLLQRAVGANLEKEP